MATDAPAVYLACGWSPQCRQALLDGPRAVAREHAPSILVSYPYLRFFLKHRSRVRLRTWCLDSGAYSAWNSGKPTNLDAYIGIARDLLAIDPQLADVIALDVIGDWRAGVRNVERMWAAGVPAIPVYHISEPEDLLVGLARDYPKIAVGGTARLKGTPAKVRFAEQVFARVWPKPIHGLAVGGRDVLLAVPWHSVDASNWEASPARFGRWKAYGGATIGLRGGAQDLRAEVAWYRELERLARFTWRREMQLLSGPIIAASADVPPPSSARPEACRAHLPEPQ